MKIHKYFFVTTVVLLLCFGERGLTMENDFPDPHQIPRTGSLSKLPIEIQTHIFSFLDQKDLLRIGGTSKSLRQAAEIASKNKCLDLSKKCLRQEDYKTLVDGPFSSLILNFVQLGTKAVCILSLSSRLEYLDLNNNSMEVEEKNVVLALFFNWAIYLLRPIHLFSPF